MAADVASLRQRLTGGFVGIAGPERWRERIDGGGIAPVYEVWHTARHHDLTVNLVLRDRAEVLHDSSDRVGITNDTWRGLAEARIRARRTARPDAVGAYLLAVPHTAVDWLGAASFPTSTGTVTSSD